MPPRVYSRRKREQAGEPAPVEAAATTETEKEETPSWDAEWLQENNKTEVAISSVEGLLQSSEFHQYMRQHGGALTVHNVLKRLQLYRDLRALDPLDFRKVWDNPNIQELVLEPVPASVAVAEYVFTIAPMVLLVFMLDLPLVKAMLLKLVPPFYDYQFDLAPHALVLMFLVQLGLFWSQRHPSALGWFWGMYSVVEHSEDSAGVLEILMAYLLEVLFVTFTMGLGLLVSIAFKLVFASRSGVGEKLCGLGLLREVRRPMTFAEDEDAQD